MSIPAHTPGDPSLAFKLLTVNYFWSFAGVGTGRGVEVRRRVDIMSHRNVEIVIGKLVTDETLRFEFRRRPASLLLRLADQGIGLTHYEVDAVLGLDVAALDRFAASLD